MSRDESSVKGGLDSLRLQPFFHRLIYEESHGQVIDLY